MSRVKTSTLVVCIVLVLVASSAQAAHLCPASQWSSSSSSSSAQQIGNKIQESNAGSACLICLGTQSARLTDTPPVVVALNDVAVPLLSPEVQKKKSAEAQPLVVRPPPAI